MQIKIILTYNKKFGYICYNETLIKSVKWTWSSTNL